MSDADDVTTSAPDPGPARDPEGEADASAGAAASTQQEEGVRFDDVGRERRTLPAPGAVEHVVAELLGAVPEVRDHLLAAADELLDAARALIEAADRVVRQQRDGQPGVGGS